MYGRKYQNDVSAFSLIELVIVMGIVTMLSVGAAVAFSYRNLVSTQESIHLQLLYNIRKIQNYAITGVVDNNAQVPKAYGIYFAEDHFYTVYRDKNGNHIFDKEDSIIEGITLDPRIRLFPSGSSLVSTVPRGFFCYDDDNVVGDDVCSGMREFEIVIEGSGISKSILIDLLSGQISQ